MFKFLPVLIAGLLSMTPTAPPPRSPAAVQIPTFAVDKIRYRLTDDTEIKLDGVRCSFEAVPKGASVEKLDVDGEKYTIIRLYFKSK